MWTLIQRFALGATLAGFAMSFLGVFLFRDSPPSLREAPAAAFLSAAASGIAFACTAALLYGAGVKILRGSRDGKLAVVLGCGCAVVQYLASAIARILLPGQEQAIARVLLVLWIAAPLAAALISRARLSRSPGRPAWHPQP